MKAFDRVLTTFGILLLLSFRADAHDPSMAHHEWFNAQEMNPAASLRHRPKWWGKLVSVLRNRWNEQDVHH